MKVILKKSQVNSLLSETAGVPMAAQFWVEVIGDMAIQAVEHLISDNTHPWTTVEMGSKDGPIDIPHKGVGSRGRDVQELAINMGWDPTSKEFVDFPLVEPEIYISLFIVPDEYTDTSSLIQSAKFQSDIEEATVNFDDKEYAVQAGGSFSFDITIPESVFDSGGTVELFKTTVKPKLMSIIYHELTHSFEFIKRTVSGSDLPGAETAWNRISMSKVGVPSWDHLLHLIYLHLSFEFNARIPEMYQTLKNSGFNTPEEFKKLLKSSRIWEYSDELASFNTEKYLEDFEVPEWVAENVRRDGGQDMTDEDVKYRVIDSLVKNWSEWYEKIVEEWGGINPQAEQILQLFGAPQPVVHRAPPLKKGMVSSPEKFLKFWEKRFNRKGMTAKKKLSRLYSLFPTQ